MSQLNSLKNDVKDAKKSITDISTEQKSLKQKLAEAMKLIAELQKRQDQEKASADLVTRDELDGLHAKFLSLSGAMQSIENKVSAAENNFFNLENRVVGLEGQGRRESLLFHDLSDIPERGNRSEHNMIGYMCHKLNTLLPRKFPITPAHISTAHLITPRNRNNKSPIVLVKFTHRWVRNEFFYDRNSIRNRNVSITEHLCGHRLWLVREARRKFGYRNVFTDQGFVYRKDNTRDYKINSIADIYPRQE